MRTIETTLYKYSELSEAGKQKAREYLSEINVDFDWWDSIYEDAAEIGLKIKGFDIGRGAYVKGEYFCSAIESIKKVLENHGQDCDTTKTAQYFLDLYNEIAPEMRDDDWLSDFEDDYLDAMCDCYLTLLRDEYEYQTSEEAVIETIEANEYEFTEDGKLA
jgi:predicted RNA-binding protein YlxR (DUF448 family)